MYKPMLTEQQSNIIRKAVYKFIDENGYTVRSVCSQAFFICVPTFSKTIGTREENRRITVSATLMDIVDKLVTENILTMKEQCILKEAGIYKRK